MKSRRYDLSALMRQAWQFVRQFGMKLSEALKAVWAQFKADAVRLALRAGTVALTYIKADGSTRPAVGTTRLELVPTDKHPKGTKVEMPYTVVTYFDFTVNGWRSFRAERLLIWKPETAAG